MFSFPEHAFLAIPAIPRGPLRTLFFVPAFRLFHQIPMGNVDAAFFINLRNDDLNDIAQFQNIFRLFNPLVINLGNMQQAVSPGNSSTKAPNFSNRTTLPS